MFFQICLHELDVHIRSISVAQTLDKELRLLKSSIYDTQLNPVVVLKSSTSQVPVPSGGSKIICTDGNFVLSEFVL